jgi:hypothetical protein
MRCDRCGYRMQEEQKDTIFRGPVILFKCMHCGSTIKKYEGSSLLSSILFGSDNGSELMTKRAEPVSFSTVGRQ